MSTWTDLDQLKGLGKLNSHLSNESYVSGYQPSHADLEVYAQIKNFDSKKFIHLARWYNHIKSFSEEERKHFHNSGKKKEEKKDEEEDFDPFAEESEDEKKERRTSRQTEKRKRRKRKKKKKNHQRKKKKKSFQSQVLSLMYLLGKQMKKDQLRMLMSLKRKFEQLK